MKAVIFLDMNLRSVVQLLTGGHPVRKYPGFVIIPVIRADINGVKEAVVLEFLDIQDEEYVKKAAEEIRIALSLKELKLLIISEGAGWYHLFEFGLQSDAEELAKAWHWACEKSGVSVAIYIKQLNGSQLHVAGYVNGRSVFYHVMGALNADLPVNFVQTYFHQIGG